MKDNNRNASTQLLRYAGPQIKIIEVKMSRNLLAVSDPSLNNWNNGSSSDGVGMEED